MIKDALRSLPARPVLFVAPALAVLVLAYYYWDQHARCSELRQQRSALHAELQSLPPAAQFRLADFTGFAWDRVRIAVGLERSGRSLECPFGWNWPAGERRRLVEAGLLTGLVFGAGDAIVAYVEVSADEVEFRGVDGVLTPETAVFAVTPRTQPGGGVALTLQR